MSKPPRPFGHRQVVCIAAHAVVLSAALAAALPSVSAAEETALPQGWVSFDDVTQTPTSPAIEIVSSNLSELVLRVTTPGVVSTAVNEDGDEYRKLEFPGYYRSTEVGHPLLPAVRQLIAVPEGCEVEVSVSAGDAAHYRGSVLYPVPVTVVRYTPEGWEYLAEEFAIDEDAYSQSGYYPSEIASVSSGGSLRGQGVALLTVYPAQYDAAGTDLRVYPSLTITLSFVGGDGGLSTGIGPFGQIARGVVLNYQGMGGDQVRGSSGPGNVEVCETVGQCAANHTDFLMIVHDSLRGGSPNWPETLAQHRADWNGWNVAIVPSAAVVKRWGKDEISDEAIKDFITAVYDSCSAEHMDDGRLGYALLVGDAKDATQGGEHYWLPAHEQSGITTDHWYACVEGGDNYADLMIGRLAADHQSELQWQVKKILAYETSASSSDPWRDEVLFSCGFAWSSCETQWCRCADASKAASTHSAFAAAESLGGWPEPDEIHAHLMEGSDCVTQRENTRLPNRTAINDGRHFVELCVHGWPGGTDTFTSWDATVLNNAGRLPFWMSYSCQTGAFDWIPADCLGEYLLHKNGMNGAVAYFGSTENSYDSAWECLGTYLWQAFFNEHLHCLGDAIAYAKLKDLSLTGKTDEVLMFNLLGDPALNVFMTDASYGDEPDYVVGPSDLRTSPAFPPASGTGYLEAVVHNRSNCDPDSAVAVVFTLCERDGSGCDTLAPVWVQPNAWSADTARVEWSAVSGDEAGHRILRARVDPDGQQDELIEDNNEAETHIGNYFPERPGFPVHVGGLVGFSPVVAEIDNELANGPEVVVATRDSGRVAVYSCADGDKLWSFTVPDSQAVRSCPVVGDLDGDRSPEVVVCYGDSVRAYHASGAPFWRYYAEGLDSGPVLGDFIAGDGRLETVVTRGSGEEADALFSALFISYDGDSLREQDFSSTWWWRSASGLELSPIAAHLDSDGRVDMVASYERGIVGACAGLVAADGDGGSWSKVFTLGGGDVGYVHPCNPVVGEVLASSTGLEVLAGARTLDCVGTVAGTPALLWRRTLHGYLAGVSLANLDLDEPLEIAATTYGAPEAPDSIKGRVYVFEGNGDPVDSFPLDYGCTGQPIIANLDGSGGPEIVVSSTRPYFVPLHGNRDISHLDILTLTAGQLERFIERPLFFWGRLISTPTIRDTNDDGSLEIWLVDGEGNLHCLEYEGTGTPSRWACYQHDERHTGTCETPVTGAYPAQTTASWWGDYLMTGDVTVDATSSLLVQPGTTVRAVALSDDQHSGVDGSLVELTVHGALRAGGDSLRPAVFTSAAESPQPEDWWGIRLRQGSTGVIDNASVSYAGQAIYAFKPDTLRVTDSRILETGLIGIRCRSNTSTHQVLVRGNKISAGILGVVLDECAADVDGNIVNYTSGYGIQIVADKGSNIHRNHFVSPASGYLSFCAVYVKNAGDGLVIDGNQLGDTYFGIPNMGIKYECSDSTTDTTMIKNNTIIVKASGDTTIGFGMYIYDGIPLVRANTITGKTFQAAFYVDGSTGKRPCLGDATAGDSCSDTTLAGCNRIIPEDPARWYVFAASGVQDTVKAECNYWNPAPTSGDFCGLVDWNPSLKGDPEGGRGPWDEDGEPDQLPALALLPNTPNPFNPETVFRFALPQAGQVRLEIYDLAGRHVRTLVDGPESAGWQTATWDGRGDRGERVASGVYFCRLEIGNRELSRKVVVLK